MSATPEIHVPVLIVGAGPAGLTAAITLARYGTAVQILERREEPSRHPKATVISTRSMELVRSWGLEREVHPPRQRGGRPAGARRTRRQLYVGRPIGRCLQSGQGIPRR